MAGASPDQAVDADTFADQVLACVRSVPPGSVVSYGDVAELIGSRAPRRVGQVLSREGGGVPWWRVLRTDGRPAGPHRDEQLQRLRAEGVLARDGRVDLRSHRWAGPDG